MDALSPQASFEFEPATPFLRWAGGKSWLARRLHSLIPQLRFNSYIEPFLGGGALFFSLGRARSSFLSDTNAALISTYIAIRDELPAVINSLSSYTNSPEFYYYIRDNFVPTQTTADAAARFIFLNKTSYNGLYRVNLSGRYNVPYGGRGKAFLDKEALTHASKQLRNATLSVSDFESSIANVGIDDLVFVDPPYTLSTNGTGFTKYNDRLFSIDDQVRLATYLRRVADSGAYFIMTNSFHPEVARIFRDVGTFTELPRASLLGGRKAHRGDVQEYLVTNIPKENA